MIRRSSRIRVACERLRARRKFGTGDRREERDNRDYDHDFNEGEAPAIFIQLLQHRIMYSVF